MCGRLVNPPTRGKVRECAGIAVRAPVRAGTRTATGGTADYGAAARADIAPGNTAPGNTAPGNTAPGNTAAGDTRPGETVLRHAGDGDSSGLSRSSRHVDSGGTGLRPLTLDHCIVTRAVIGGLVLAVALLVCFAVVVSPFDFNVYRWGGEAVRHGLQLYEGRIATHWFTYPPFAATVFIPAAAAPDLAGRVGWELASLLALAWAATVTTKLAGYRPNWQVIGAVTVMSITLEPMYHTFYLGQINLILLALILADVWRTSRGRPAGIGIGMAAAIKLTPLIFIPLLLLARRTRDGITATVAFIGCGLIGYLIEPGDSRLYWHKLFDDTLRVGASYISNQSPYGAAVRIAGGSQFVGGWYDAVPPVLGVIGLVIATALARGDDWLGAATVAGVTGLLVSPISWTHHWVWILPALVVLLRGGSWSWIAAALTYLLFVIAPMWFTPYHGGPGEFGFHGLATVLANSYLIAALAFLGYMGRQACLVGRSRKARHRTEAVPMREPATASTVDA